MPVKSKINAQDRMYLPTVELYETTGKFGSIVPAFNNNYDVHINFEPSELKGYIKEKALFDMSGDPGSMLALLCSEAVLPGSQMQFSEVDGLRQGVQQSFATYRRYPEVILTWYSQKDYYTNDVFNSWLDFISPPVDLGKKPSFRKMNYPDEYKCAVEITAFSKDTTDSTERLQDSNQFRTQMPSSITYYLERAFPVSIVAAPLAYGRAELVKTTITFKYDFFYTKRISRVGPIIKEGDIMMPPRLGISGNPPTDQDILQDRLSIQNSAPDKNKNKRVLGGQGGLPLGATTSRQGGLY